MIRKKPHPDDIEGQLSEGLNQAMMLGPFPFEHVRPRLRDQIPVAVWWWLFGFVVGAMTVLVAIEMFTDIDLGLVPN